MTHTPLSTMRKSGGAGGASSGGFMALGGSRERVRLASLHVLTVTDSACCQTVWDALNYLAATSFPAALLPPQSYYVPKSKSGHAHNDFRHMNVMAGEYT